MVHKSYFIKQRSVRCLLCKKSLLASSTFLQTHLCTFPHIFSHFFTFFQAQCSNCACSIVHVHIFHCTMLCAMCPVQTITFGFTFLQAHFCTFFSHFFTFLHIFSHFCKHSAAVNWACCKAQASSLVQQDYLMVQKFCLIAKHKIQKLYFRAHLHQVLAREQSEPEYEKWQKAKGLAPQTDFLAISLCEVQNVFVHIDKCICPNLYKQNKIGNYVSFQWWFWLLVTTQCLMKQVQQTDANTNTSWW